jgi:hypothetical protein
MTTPQQNKANGAKGDSKASATCTTTTITTTAHNSTTASAISSAHDTDQSKHDDDSDAVQNGSNDNDNNTTNDTLNGMDDLAGTDEPFVIVSQEEFSEHASAITHAKFSTQGNLIASCDMDNIVR